MFEIFYNTQVRELFLIILTSNYMLRQLNVNQYWESKYFILTNIISNKSLCLQKINYKNYLKHSALISLNIIQSKMQTVIYLLLDWIYKMDTFELDDIFRANTMRNSVYDIVTVFLHEKKWVFLHEKNESRIRVILLLRTHVQNVRTQFCVK